MSLRGWQLAAFAYVLLLLLVAFESPLALNLSKRVNAEIEAEAVSQAQLVAASAAGHCSTTAFVGDLVRTAARSVGGRVIVVDRGGQRLVADSAGSGLARTAYGSRRSWPRRCPAGSRRAGASATRSTRSCSTQPSVLDEGRRSERGADARSIDAVERRSTATLALVGLGLAALLLGLGVAWLVLRRDDPAAARAHALAARRVAAGDLNARGRGGAREHREVARAFNDMTQRLGQSLVAQRDFVANAAHQLRTRDRPAPAAGRRASNGRPGSPARSGGLRARGRPPVAHGDRSAHARPRGPAAGGRGPAGPVGRRAGRGRGAGRRWPPSAPAACG